MMLPFGTILALVIYEFELNEEASHVEKLPDYGGSVPPEK
jgi:hypothetical protein